MELDQDRRWRVLARLSGLGHENIDELLSAERERDATDQGAKSSLSAQVLGADMDAKRQWLAEALNAGGERSVADRRVIMRALFSAYRPEVQRELLDDVLTAISLVVREGGQTFLRDFSNSLVGGYCSAESVERMQRALTDHPDLPATLERRLRVSIQEDERCLNIQALDG
jgi:hypothetical protein